MATKLKESIQSLFLSFILYLCISLQLLSKNIYKTAKIPAWILKKYLDLKKKLNWQRLE